MTRARPISILIVEDERIVARDLQQSLRAFDFDVFAIAASGEEAIALASTRLPDIVLMDIRIKGELDGIETAAIMRDRFGVPVVYLTAHADDATLARAKITTPYSYLLKPVKPNELRTAIDMSVYRHDMEQRLRERERISSTTLRSISDPVVSVDLAGRIAFMNPAAEALLGVTSSSAVGKPANEVLKTPGAREIAIEIALRERRTVEEIDTVVGAGGDVRVTESAAPVQDSQGTLGAVMVVRDVAKIQKLQVVDQLLSLGMMAGGIAHEVNNPLAVVVANSAYAIHELTGITATHRATLGADLKTRVDEIVTAMRELELSAERIAKVTSDLRDFARPPALPAGLVEVRRVVERAIRHTLPELRDRALLETHLDEIPVVRANDLQLERVMIALISNAANAIDPGNLERNRVVIATRSEDGRAIVEVRDTGRGMPPEVVRRAFEPFFSGVARSGLGLSIARGIITALGGEIKVESQVGVGTAFRIMLPAVDLAEDIPPSVTRTRARILVIDDDQLVLGAVRRVLQRDHAVTCVEGAKLAIEALERDEQFDVIISDIMMPEMSGIQLYEWMVGARPDDASRLVFTGSPVDARTEDFLRSVPNHFIEKPFRSEELLALVQRLVTR
jgi:two-component system, cell cycle sensor histidine kinase and response regulator CckA